MDKNIEESLIEAINRLENLNSTSSHLIEIKNEPLISVIMTTYNVENYVLESIQSILSQTYKNLELIIVDDASSDNTVEIIKELNDPRIQLYRNKVNCGTYYSKNFGLTQARGRYIAIQDSDDISDKDRLKKQVGFLESFETKQFVLCQYTRFDNDGNHLIAPRLAFQSSMIRKTVFDDLGFYDTVRVAADDEFNARMMKFYGNGARGTIEELLYFNRSREDSLTSTIEIGSTPRTAYVENYKKWHTSISGKNELFIEYPQKQRPFPVDDKIKVRYTEKLEPEVNISEVTLKGRQITGSMVTIPSRESILEQVVNAILPQVDVLQIYLNNFDDVPNYLKLDKVDIFRSQEHGDLADNGKFYSPPKNGFHLTFDDDILYPSDYVKTLLSKLKDYQYSAAIGSHGIELKEGFKRYYDMSSREVFSFYRETPEDRYVHIIGTGTLGYHTSLLNFDLSEVDKTHMIDIFFGLHCQKNSIPLICIEHPEAWMQEIETPTDTRIFDNFSKNDADQTALVKSIAWNYNYLDFDIKDNIDLNLTIEERMLRKLEDFGKRLIENERTIVNQKRTIEKQQNDLAWYARTFDHLPKWFLKIGGIFRRF
ncbi:glycosyltransferase family 2 protein [Fulvivirga lutea]|uniref:Glycosyltransferase family 2 protein n=1 Tax=Fulvivirga lutea TaxID=2810512 RepID=A0A975A1K3_9BACT|nr:glycosyltransferase family 2 protein [Fulvivirga lutea]QSE98406.1 glycosyltransferase family 2 protein [Fulvivirga lutea]